MLKRERVINKLRDLGYVFKREAPNRFIYKRGSHRVFVPKTDLVSETWVLATLFTCGCKQQEAEEFVRIAKV
jgi:hypothetical protein